MYLLEDINDSISLGIPISLLKYRQYINHVITYTNSQRDYYLNNSTYSYTNGVTLLTHICKLLDFDYMKRHPNDIDRYMYYLKDLRINIMQMYDTTITGGTHRNYYISKSNTKEYILTSDDINTLKYLPFNSNWDTWKNISPLKLWYHDSDEFNLRLTNNLITFHKHYPTYVIFILNPITLLFKWYKYNETSPYIQKDIIHFLTHHVFDTLQKNLTDIWLLSQLKYVITNCDNEENILYRKYSDIQIDPQYGKIAPSYTDGMMDIFHALTLIKNSNILCTNFIHAKTLLTTSLYDRLQIAQNNWSTSYSFNYLYLTLLRDLSLFDMLFSIISLNKNNSIYKNGIIEFKRTITRLINKRPWMQCRNSHIRDTLETSILTTYEKIYNAE